MKRRLVVLPISTRYESNVESEGHCPRSSEEDDRSRGGPNGVDAEGVHLNNIDPLRVGEAIRGSQILPTLKPPEREMLRKNIGDDAYNLLQKRDDLLSAWADHYAPSDRIAEIAGADDGDIDPPTDG